MKRLKTKQFLAATFLAFTPMVVQAATVWNSATTEEVPGVTFAGMTPSGFRFEISAPPGDYPVQYSTNLLQWFPLGVIEPPVGTGDIVDAGALGRPAGFYRAAGGFEETRMHVIALESAVESSGFPGYQMLGGLWSGHSNEAALFQSSNPADGLLRLVGGTFSQFRIEPGNTYASLAGYAEIYGDEDVFPVIKGVDSFNVITDDDVEIEFFKLEGGEHSLVGLFNDTYDYDDPDSDYTSTEESIGMVFLAAKCTDAQEADMTGDWGFVINLIEAEPDRVLYSGMAVVASMAAAPLRASVSKVTEFKIDQFFDPAFVDAYSVVEAINEVFPASLSADGSFQLDAGMQFKGFVSPSARFFAVAATDPGVESIPPSEEDVFQPVLAEAQTQVIVGVKRDPDPQLGGKTYRIIRKGWWVEDDGFEIDRSADGDRLVFNAGGTSVTRNSESLFTTVFFDGVIKNSVPGEETVSLTLAVTKDPATGQIDMEGGFTEDGEVFTYRSFGFAQEGGDLLVLVDSITTSSDGSAGLGLIIALREP